VCAHFETINRDLMDEVEDKKPDFFETIIGAVSFRKKYMDLSNYLLKKTKKATEMQTELLREISGEGTGQYKLKFDNGLALAHDPNIKVYDCNIRRCRVFTSAVRPMRMVFESRIFPDGWQEGDKVPESKDYAAMIKNGDDMRQD